MSQHHHHHQQQQQQGVFLYPSAGSMNNLNNVSLNISSHQEQSEVSEVSETPNNPVHQGDVELLRGIQMSSNNAEFVLVLRTDGRIVSLSDEVEQHFGKSIMNPLTRGLWLLLNLFCGAPLANILFLWVACDMQMPLLITNFISTYLPICNSVFDVPYVHITGLSSSVGAKLIFNAFLYAIFGFAHTLFAQEFVQVILSRWLFPKQALRTIYCMIVSLTTFTIIGFWQHTHVQLWNWLPSTMDVYQQQLVLLILYSIIYAPGWYVVFKFGPLEFCGVKQIFNRLESSGCPYASSIKSEERTTGTQALITSGLFRLCRHPLYLFTILALAITPVTSLDRLAFVIYNCLYASVGIRFEERKLVQIFGQAYVDYQQRVPAIIPFTTVKNKQN